ncbi:metalloexopeptidase activity [Sparganum proliferum]
MGVIYLLLLAFASGILADFPTPPPSTVELKKYDTEQYDCVIVVNDNYTELITKKDNSVLTNISKALNEIGGKLNNIEATAGIYASSHLTGKALIYSPTGPLNTDISDSRSIYDAGRRGAELAAKSGKKNLLLVVGPMATAPKEASWHAPQLKALNAVLGAFYGLYVPLQYREAHKDRASKYANLYLHAEDNTHLDWVVKHALAIEKGRVIARDLCGADPERITPTEFVKYTNYVLENYTDISKNEEKITNDSYPMIAMVQRASMEIPRFNGSVMKIDYASKKSSEKSLYFLGLGNTYDTGGADLKIDGTMVGMSRQKCGAAAVVGLMITASELKAAVNLHGRLAVVRNNIGTRSFVVDTIVKVKSGKRIRIGNTAADGRMILADLLYHAKEEALKDKATDKHIFTVATLTTHVIRCYKYIAGIMDNGPAAKARTAEELQQAGDMVADIGEISVVRKEDYDFNLNTLETEDLLQSNNADNDGTNRGHQIPMAFMIQASGLSENGLSAASDKQLKYTHLDVSGSAGGIMDNGPAAKVGTAEELQKAGDKVADIGEISVVRKEDYEFNLNTLETEDLLQSNNADNDGTNRGHQIPMAFMVQASGLSENGLNAEKGSQLKYTHLDVSGSAGVIDTVPTASPLTMLTMKYLVQSEPGRNQQ